MTILINLIFVILNSALSFFGIRWITRLRLISARLTMHLTEELLIYQINVGLRKLRISCERFVFLRFLIIVGTFSKLYNIEHIDVVFVI